MQSTIRCMPAEQEIYYFDETIDLSFDEIIREFSKIVFNNFNKSTLHVSLILYGLHPIFSDDFKLKN